LDRPLDPDVASVSVGPFTAGVDASPPRRNVGDEAYDRAKQRSRKVETMDKTVDPRLKPVLAKREGPACDTFSPDDV
jgi:hypothetical protein